MLRFTYRLIVILAASLHLMILGLITEKLIMRTLTFLNPCTYRARVRCTCRTPSRNPCIQD